MTFKGKSRKTWACLRTHKAVGKGQEREESGGALTDNAGEPLVKFCLFLMYLRVVETLFVALQFIQYYTTSS